MHFRLTLYFLFVAFFCVAQKPDSFINASEAKRIIEVLASDSMKGRANFSKELEKAATFISSEFQKAGLQPFENFTKYLQPFLFLEKTEPLERIVLNDEWLPQKQYFFISPFYFPPSLELKDFQQKRFDSAISFQNLLDSLKYWKDIDAPLLILLPKNRKDLLDAFYHPTTVIAVPSHIRLVMQEPGQVEQLSVYFKPELRKRMLFNVLGYLPGKSKPNEMVLITAHYDHVGAVETKNDLKIYNGANDNASGTTSMMMLANYFAAKKDNERSILFVAFAGEEIGLIGSQYLASLLSADSVVAVINLEMLGKTTQKEKGTCMVTGNGSLPNFFMKEARKNGVIIRDDKFPKEGLFYRSDNYSFAKNGVPAHTFMIWMENDPDYHHPTDKIQTLDLANMAEIVKGLVAPIEALVSGAFTPKRLKL